MNKLFFLCSFDSWGTNTLDFLRSSDKWGMSDFVFLRWLRIKYFGLSSFLESLGKNKFAFLRPYDSWGTNIFSYLRFDPKTIHLRFFHLHSSSSLSKTFIPLRSLRFFATTGCLSLDLECVGTILTVITCGVHM